MFLRIRAFQQVLSFPQFQLYRLHLVVRLDQRLLVIPGHLDLPDFLSVRLLRLHHHLHGHHHGPDHRPYRLLLMDRLDRLDHEVPDLRVFRYLPSLREFRLLLQIRLLRSVL